MSDTLDFTTPQQVTRAYFESTNIFLSDFLAGGNKATHVQSSLLLKEELDQVFWRDIDLVFCSVGNGNKASIISTS